MAAMIAADSAVIAKSVIFTRATGTPRLRAATGDPPAPAIQLPNRVRPRTYAPIAAMRIHHTMETRSEPVWSPRVIGVLQLNSHATGSAATAVRSSEMNVIGVTTDVRTEVNPRMMNSVAR